LFEEVLDRVPAKISQHYSLHRQRTKVQKPRRNVGEERTEGPVWPLLIAAFWTCLEHAKQLTSDSSSGISGIRVAECNP